MDLSALTFVDSTEATIFGQLSLSFSVISQTREVGKPCGVDVHALALHEVLVVVVDVAEHDLNGIACSMGEGETEQ